MTGDIIVKRAENAGGTPTALVPNFKLAVIGRSLGANTEGSADVGYSVTGGGGLANATNYSHDLGEYCNSVEYIKDEDDEQYLAGIHFSLSGGGNADIDHKRIRGSSGQRLTLQELTWVWTDPLAINASAIEEITEEYTGTPVDSKVITWYCITVKDKNGNESSKGALKKVAHYKHDDAGVSDYKLILNWSKKKFVSGYIVYRTDEDFGNTEPTNSDFKLIKEITDENKTTYEDDYSEIPGAAPPVDNSTEITPKAETECVIYYHYADMVYNTPKEYYSWHEVMEDHGVGSELTNVARIFMSSSFNNVASLVTVVPEGTDINAYYSALDTLETEEVHFILFLYAGSTSASSLISNWGPVYDHCQSLSDPSSGQKERRAIFALPNNSNASEMESLLSGFQSKSDKGKSAYLVVVDNFACEINSWIGDDEEYSYHYNHKDTADIDITPLVMAGASVAKYLSLGDLAEPLTEKDVAGFAFTRSKFSLTQIQQYTSKGALVVKNSYGVPVVYRSINMSLPLLTLEDAEMNICTTEDFLKQDLRRRLKALRGNKMTTAVLGQAERIIKFALDYYTNIGLIKTYDTGSIEATQNATEKDQIDGKFKYMPMYPVNKIWITFGYTFDMS